MRQASDLARAALTCWTSAGVAAAALLAVAVWAKQPGLLLPVELCTAFGFYSTLRARRECRLIAGYVREFHETERDGAQWHTRLAQLHASPGSPDHADWLPPAIANALTLASIVFSWLYANGAAHGELMAGMVTMAGVGFCVHSIVESKHLERAQSAERWTRTSTGLREVTPGARRVGISR